MREERTTPRPAATLVLLRDGRAGPEVLLTMRSRSLRFMAGVAVFPGGAVNPGDLDERWEMASNLSRSEAAHRLDQDDGAAALGAFICALREAFEEVGFLAGTGPLERLADEVGDEDWLERILKLGAVVDAAALVPAGRWVTPELASRRFDTQFFAVRAAGDWNPQPDAREVDAVRWSTPAAALDDMASGKLVMAPPTIHVLQRISGCTDVTEAIAALSRRFDAGPMSLSVRVHPAVNLVLAPNPGLMTGPGTNSYIIGTHDACIVDPAVDEPEYLDALLNSAAGVKTIAITHRHPDHVGGVRKLVEQTGAVLRAWGPAKIEGISVKPLSDGEVLSCGEARMRCIPTPGHASDHVCFLLEDVLLSGDTILGEGTAVIAPPDGDLDAYLGSLRRLRELPIQRILPGHFRPLEDGRRVIDDLLEHREQRHRAILRAIEQQPASVEEIVEIVYVDTSPDLHGLAALTVAAHLETAERRGQVRRTAQKWHRLRMEQEPDFPE